MRASSTESERWDWRSWAALGFLVIALGFHGWWASRNWHAPGLDGHHFRQSQTALTIQAMLDEPLGWPRLDYATPVLGKPWSIPMEYPLYQWLVSLVCRATGWSIELAGRGVSLAGFWLALPALWLLVRRAGLARGESFLALVPVVVAPVYIFYSRVVMIESVAMAASAWFLVGVLGYRARPRTGWLLLALLAGLAAVLTKATTWAAFCVPWAVIWLADGWQVWRTRQQRAGWLEQAVLIGVPLLVVGWAWVWIADQIKLLNPNAGFLVSDQLHAFNFGSVAERVDSTVWSQWLRHVREALGAGWTILGGALVAVIVCRRRVGLALAAIGFLGAPLIFFGLYYHHEYYFYACAAFGGLFLGAGAAGLWRRGGARPDRWHAAALVLLLVVGAGQYQSYRGALYLKQHGTADPSWDFYRLFRGTTQPNDVVVVLSSEWSSVIPYYTHRRALVIPDFQMFYRPEKVRESISRLWGENVPLLVFMGESREHPAWIKERVEDLHMMQMPLVETDFATIFVSREGLDRFQRGMRALRLPSIEWNRTYEGAPYEQRVPLTEEWRAQLHGVDPRPNEVVLPFGLSRLERDGVSYVMLHGGSELYFDVGPEVRHFSCRFRVNPDSFDQFGFDGLIVLVESYSGNEDVRVLAESVVDPKGDRGARELQLDLPVGTTRVSLRVLARGGLAYDHAWFSSIRLD